MKIRTGFVSNSSSSSFCIYGIETTPEDLINVAKEKGIDVSELETQYKEDGYWEDLDWNLRELTNNTSLNIYRFSEEDLTYIGCSMGAMMEDETPREFKRKIREDLMKIFKDITEEDIEIHEGTYHC